MAFEIKNGVLIKYTEEKGVTDVVVPDGVTSIGEEAFKNCGNINSVTLPDSVTSIQNNAFLLCQKLTSIIIPDSVTSIGDSAFKYCPKLKFVTLPDSITSINDNLFLCCLALETIKIPDSVTSIGNNAFSGCSSLLSITIPDSVTYIGKSAFYSCLCFESVKIPDSVITIDDSAFKHCTDLKSIYISESVTSIGEEAFYYCENLESIYVSENNQNYASIDGALFNKSKNTLLFLPKEKNHDNYVIPDSVTSVDKDAFSMCNLQSITIPDSITCIDMNLFNIINLKSVYIYESNKNYISIDGIIFSTDKKSIIFFPKNKNCDSYVIPDSVVFIGNSAFSSCSNLKSITIPDSVISIGNSAFIGCANLKSITIPKSVKSIGSFSFALCTSLTSIDIPDNVVSIEQNAFWDCKNLESITIPCSIDFIDKDVFSMGFFATRTCFELIKITIKSKDSAIKIYDKPKTYGDNLNKDLKKLLDFMKNENEEKEKILNKLETFSYKLTVAFYLLKKYKSEVVNEFFKNNIEQIVCSIIDMNVIEELTDILHLGYITEENIDDMIMYAIENKNPEMQIILSNYKNDNFGFDSSFDKFIL